MHDNRRSRNLLLNRFDNLEMQALFPFEFKGSVTCPYRRRKRIATGLLDEFHRLNRIGQKSATLVYFHIFLDAA